MNKIRIILNLIKSDGKFLLLFLFALYFLNVQVVSAQLPPQGKPKTVSAPTPKPTPKTKPTPKSSEVKKVIVNEADTPAEKSITVESKVNISLCVTEGQVRINGWDRNEVRAFVKDGSQVGFKVAQKSPKSGKPVWIYVLGFDPLKTKEIKPEECLSGDIIELDVPRDATINLKSEESEMTIESVARVRVKNNGGNIFLNDIAQGIEATTYEGTITVEKSSGSMTLDTTSGNIVAIDVSPSEVGDFFKAKTSSGNITLQSVGHRQIETNSTSGSTNFVGEILNGGQYSFTTQNGSIGLAIPPDSSCRINASFGFGDFNSEIPMKNLLKKEQSLSAQLGGGDANVILKTYSGVIRIRKRQ